MGARLRVLLTSEEERELFNLRKADVPQKVKDRAEIIRLNAHGWYVEKIAEHFHWTPQTVRQVLHKWNQEGLKGLWELPGRGLKPKLKPEDMEYLEGCLEQEPRTYNSQQLAQKIEEERGIKLSRYTIMRALKKRGSYGNEPEPAINKNKTQ
jgi:transposase